MGQLGKNTVVHIQIVYGLSGEKIHLILCFKAVAPKCTKHHYTTLITKHDTKTTTGPLESVPNYCIKWGM